MRVKFLIGFSPLVMIAFDLLLGVSHGFSQPAIPRSLLLLLWMVSWWIFEIVPLGITALIPLIYLPFYGIMKIDEVAPDYANPVIYLFLGGFIIARAFEKTKLDERFALNILQIAGRSGTGIVVGFVIPTAFLSMWISNTATTVMMVPIAMSVINFLEGNLNAQERRSLPHFSAVLFLSIAYAANIGGIMTPVGTPPNVVFLGYLKEIYGREVDFWRWLLATMPLGIGLMVVMVILLKWLYPFSVQLPASFGEFIRGRLKKNGPIDNCQMVTAAVFLSAAGLWMFKDVIHKLLGNQFLNDTSIAILAGVSLFFIPTTRSRWDAVLGKGDISQLPWDIVLLFGGGMAMAGALKQVGIIEMATSYFASFTTYGPYFLVFAVAVVVLFLTELMSNVALCVVALPIIMKLGESQGIDPLLIGMLATLAASFAFTMPISTPPNAIVFGTQKIKMGQMMRGGLLLNIIALALTMTLGYFFIHLLLI